MGTWESLLRSLKSHRKLMQLRKEQNLPPLVLPDSKPPHRWVKINCYVMQCNTYSFGSYIFILFRRLIFYSDMIHRWCVPFPGADKAVVCQLPASCVLRKNSLYTIFE